MENHNWSGNNSGTAFNDPDLENNPLAPYINGELKKRSAHPKQYYNPPGNHPSQPNYLWLEAGTNFGVLADTQPGQPQLTTPNHLVSLLTNAGISWKVYAEQDYGNPEFTGCPLDFTYLDVEHLPVVYFNDVNDGLNPNSAVCMAHVVPYSHLAKDIKAQATARYNLIIPNLCHQGHEGVTPCDPNEPGSNTLRSDQWLKKNLPVILASDAYKDGGAVLVIWDEAEDTAQYGDGPVGLFLLSPFAKGEGHREYSNAIHYDHSSTLKTIQEIFGVTPLLGAAADPATQDLGDLFK
jgi:phospholipase C